VTWVFFRAKTFDKAWLILKGMFGANAAAVPIFASVYLVSVGLIVGGIVTAHWLMRERTLEALVARTPPVVLSMVWIAMAFTIIITQGKGNAFIYFQF
jgi:alginate O-acetyltransferase complex protein AlgI